MSIPSSRRRAKTSRSRAASSGPSCSDSATGDSPARTRLNVGRRAAVVRLAAAVDEPRRARPGGKILAAEPVVLVVPAAMAGPGEVRDFVVLEAGRGQRVDRRLVHLPLDLFLDARQLAVRQPRPERGAFFERQAVGRDVIGLQARSPRPDRAANRPAIRRARRRSGRAKPNERTPRAQITAPLRYRAAP